MEHTNEGSGTTPVSHDHTPLSQEEKVTDHTLLGTSDAMVWAEEFCRIFKGKVVGVAGAPDEAADIDEGLMVGWFSNAMGVGEQAGVKRVPIEGPLHAFLHFVSMDTANAAMHCAEVRYSPITFRLAEFLRYVSPTLFLDLPSLDEVLGHMGQYEEDKGR